MSKYFRSPTTDDSSSSSSESDASDDESIHENALTGDGLDISISRSGAAEDDRGPFASTTRGSDVHRDALLHALLEERCINDVIRDHARRGGRARQPGDAEVRREAQIRYQALCARLAPLNLVSMGFQDDRHADVRQRYRDGLDLLSRARLPSAALESTLPANLRQLIPASHSQDLVPYPRQIPQPHVELLHNIPAFNSIIPSRYLRDFHELGPLGKGGYGQVFSVRHRLDGCAYAIKKVPIRSSTLARVHELEEMLGEVRALSRLDHPNVVRYFGSWIEWTTSSDSFSSSSQGVSFVQSDRDSRVSEADESWPSTSLHRIVTESGSTHDDIGIVFEASSVHRSTVTESTREIDATQATLSDRSVNAGAVISASEPTLALHIQMDVYPITLAEYICPKNDGSLPPLAHCFHLEPSIRILLALLDGVEYLHAQGIVHRDLKPANIFLRVEPSTSVSTGNSTAGSFNCSACQANHHGHPTDLRIRIGDFGLVTQLARMNDQASDGRTPIPSTTTSTRKTAPVGTEIYRPAHATSNISPDLDVFALGIIACELLCRFDTQMERRTILSAIREGRLPELAGFGALPDDATAGRVRDCLLDMLSTGLKTEDAGNGDSARSASFSTGSRLAGLKAQFYEIIEALTSEN